MEYIFVYSLHKQLSGKMYRVLTNYTTDCVDFLVCFEANDAHSHDISHCGAVQNSALAHRINQSLSALFFLGVSSSLSS